MPSNKDSRRRHSRTVAQPKSLTPPSTLSVLSSSTSGSNSTVTQERAFRSSLRPSKQYDVRRPLAKEPRPVGESGKGRVEPRSEKEGVNVFAYMEKEEQAGASGSEDDEIRDETPDEDASTTSTAPKLEPPLPQTPICHAVETRAIEHGDQHVWRKTAMGEGSLHSDSGISVRSSSPERESPVPRYKYPNVRGISSSTRRAPLINHPGCASTDSANSLEGPTSPVARDWPSICDASSSPEEYYGVSRSMVPQTTPAGQALFPGSPVQESTQLVRNTARVPAAPTKSMKPIKPTKGRTPGYDSLASAIGSRDDAFLKPIYRKFEILNNRILLYLQDEISEMEDELRELDHTIAREDRSLGKTCSSRRAEARLPTQLQWRRLDLIGRSYTKVEQYNRALASYSNLIKNLEPASGMDIAVYRDWIAEHAPIAEQEAAFLQHEADLVAVSVQASTTSTHMQNPHRSQLETSVIIVAFTLVATIVVFKVVPRLLARIVISAIVGVAALCTLAPSALSDFKSIKDWRRGISIYAAVMLVLAIVVS